MNNTSANQNTTPKSETIRNLLLPTCTTKYNQTTVNAKLAEDGKVYGLLIIVTKCLYDAGAIVHDCIDATNLLEYL